MLVTGSVQKILLTTSIFARTTRTPSEAFFIFLGPTSQEIQMSAKWAHAFKYKRLTKVLCWDVKHPGALCVTSDAKFGIVY